MARNEKIQVKVAAPRGLNERMREIAAQEGTSMTQQWVKAAKLRVVLWELRDKGLRFYVEGEDGKLTAFLTV